MTWEGFRTGVAGVVLYAVWMLMLAGWDNIFDLEGEPGLSLLLFMVWSGVYVWAITRVSKGDFVPRDDGSLC